MSETGALTGSDIDLYLGPELIGTTVSAEVDQQSQAVRVDVLGRRNSREILIDGVSVRFSAENVYMAAEDLVAFGIVQDGIFGPTSFPKVVAVVNDRAHNRVVCRVEGLVCTQFRLSVAKGRAVMSSTQWEGILMKMGRLDGT